MPSSSFVKQWLASSVTIDLRKNLMDNFYCWLANRLPERLVKWCFVRVIAYSSSIRSSTDVCALSPSQCLKDWVKK